jgi:anti-anti-sigma factor
MKNQELTDEKEKNQELTVTQDKNQGGGRFTLKGRVNSVNAPRLQYILEKAQEDGDINIVLNMLHVEFLSSAGIRVILKTHKDVVRAGGALGIEEPSENVKNVLGMAALEEMLV